MINDQTAKNRKILVLASAALFLIISIFIVVFFFTNRHNNMVIVTNLASCAEGVPDSRRDDFFRRLYPIIKEQLEYQGRKIEPSYDAVIRKDSCKIKEYTSPVADQATSFNAKFIIDIEELGYSFRVGFNWVKRGLSSAGIDLGSVQINCLLPSDLIFGDFACDKNSLIVATNTGVEEILSLLPYFGDGFMLTPTQSSTSASGYSIILTYDPPESVYLGGTLSIFKTERYAMMEKFLQDNDVDIKNYTIIENYKIN